MKIERIRDTLAEDFFNSKIAITSGHHAEVLAHEHAVAFTVARVANADFLKDIHGAISDAMQNGTSFKQFKRDFQKTMTAKGWASENEEMPRRLKIIFETNMRSARAAGRWTRIQDEKDDLPFLKYMQSTAAKRRHEHQKYYGLIRPVEDPIWNTIFPPNGYGCKCWVMQITQQQAEREGISEPISNIDDVQESFRHPHGDRIGALKKIAFDKHGRDFHARLTKELNQFQLDLIRTPEFNESVHTVIGENFAERFPQLREWTNEQAKNYFKEHNLDPNNREDVQIVSKALQEQFRASEGRINWVAATLDERAKQILQTRKNIINLSAETIIKMFVHHPELQDELFSMFQDSHVILKNAIEIVKQDENRLIYYSIKDKFYKASVKMTEEGEELYLLTLFKVREKTFRKELEKLKM